MNTEPRTVSNERDWRFTDRAKKLGRGFLMAVAGSITGVAVVGGSMAKAENNTYPEHAPEIVTESGHGEAIIGRSESDWIEGAAKRAVISALGEAIPRVLSESGIDGDATKVSEIIEQLTKYAKVHDAIGLAYENSDVVPDPGDTFEVDLEVTKTDGDISYEIVSASIEDIPNNQ